MNHLKILHFLLACLFSFSVFGQKQGDRWYFGQKAGVEFTTGEAVYSGQGQIPFFADHSEGTSVVSDSSGALLFYTNGQTIWNSNHAVMSNGDGLLGNWSSTQSSIIVPEPNSDTRFYVFTTDGFYQSNLKNGFRYSVVDMCGDQGLGEILTHTKNTLLLDTVSEKLSAVKHANGMDYWVVVHKYWSDAFHAFLLTGNGIESEIVSHVGYVHEGNSPSGTTAAIGQMKISPDGSRLALCLSNRNPTLFEVFDFNDATGQVSNSIQIPTTTVDEIVLGTIYGIEFSPDNSKLYLGASYEGIYQVDLSADGGHPTSVINSLELISDPVDQIPFGLQLGPNGKIYTANWGDTTLGVIHRPNRSGSDCNYVPDQVSLNGHMCSYSLPDFIAGYGYTNGLVDCSTGMGESMLQMDFIVYPNPVQQVGTIEFNNRHRLSIELKLFDSTGRLVLRSNPTGSDRLIFDMSHLKDGIYLFQLKSGSEILGRGKVIKQTT